MSSPAFREPTNEELWSQPPPPQPQVQPHQALAPIPPPQVQPAPPPYPVPAQPAQRADRSSFVLAIVSMALAIPLSAIAVESSSGGLRGLLVVWLGIVGLNFAHAWSRRNGRRQG